jgi:hypothetical protein
MTPPEKTPKDDKDVSPRVRLALMAAVPIGAIIGFFIGGYLCLGVLKWEGKGQSHFDAMAMAASSVAGLLGGAILCPIIFWLLIGRKRK